MKLEPEWVTGFVDGEGCFHVSVNAHSEMKAGFQVLPEFTVVQHERDAKLLHALKEFFGCGVVRKNHGDRLAFRVRGHEHLRDRIVPFFDEHPLRSEKRIDFLKFKEVVRRMERGDHLQHEGLDEIRALASQMNRGRSR